MESLCPVKGGFNLTLTKWWPWWFSSYKMSSPLIVPWPLALTSLLALTGDWQLFERNCRSLSWPNKVRCEVLFYLEAFGTLSVCFFYRTSKTIGPINIVTPYKRKHIITFSTWFNDILFKKCILHLSGGH